MEGVRIRAALCTETARLSGRFRTLNEACAGTDSARAIGRKARKDAALQTIAYDAGVLGTS